LVYAGGDFTRDASGARVGGSAFKKGSIPRAVDIPRSSCDHRALLPSGPLDGVRRCSLEGSAPRSSLLATSPSESVRSRWCRRSCLLPAAVGGVQPHGGWHPFTTIRLQGFSSRSPAAVPRRWSSRRMTTSLVVGRGKPGCGLPPALSFKDVHHPRWGGGRAEWELRLLRGLGGLLLPPAFGGEGRSPASRRRQTLVRGTDRLWRRQLPRVWLPGLGCSGAASGAGAERGCPSTAWATIASCVGWPHPRLLPRHQSHREVVQDVVRRVGGGGVLGWSCPHSRSEDGAKTSSCALVQPLPIGAEVVAATGGADVAASAGEAAHCRGGRLRWRDR
jgi:hypothetical protein